MKKILRINLTDQTFQFEDIRNQYIHLGGRGLSSKIINDEVKPDCDPLGSDNKIVLAPGILSGTKVLCSGRLSVGTKSPLTNTIKEANAGGAVAAQLAGLGLHCVILEGCGKNHTLVKITPEGVIFVQADKLARKGNYQCVEILRKEHGDEIGIISIGPAGEMQLKASAIAVSARDHHLRFAARGGVGAVMGSKNLKAVVIDTGGKKEATPKDAPRFDRAATALAKGVAAHPLIGGLKNLGTPVLVNMINALGALPTKNFSSGQFKFAEQLSGEQLAELISKRPDAQASHACMKGCIIHCSNILTDDNGNLICSSIEYETLALLGSNCMIGDIETVARLNRLCNDLGLDTMEAGGALAIAMEAGKLPWGDGEKALLLLNSIYDGHENGLMIGNGAHFTGKTLGVTRIPSVKKQCISGYDPRVLKGTGVTYATSTMGADHTCGNALPSPANPEYNPSSPTGQAPVSQFLQAYFAAIDSLGLCLFASLPVLDIPELKQHIIECASAMLGEPLSDEYIEQLGESVIKTEKSFNKAVGFDRQDDRLPDFFSHEPLPENNAVFDVSDEELDSVHSG
ncbi:aldehyde ferredoxin oxidoreductase [Desulfomarina profundi]|uniref:Aldehyde ferredoxin oxidoreductase n=1 Tax=Desulfomarina profundi TaxID=2772557 RepID=A0A8D5FK07_9BACT|nr:aldehyde ferredoxin oxidoreductase C-terminal domain-containing protein [Desulfomarina profundi]BCL61996.1 aldehyde ferredoxin oxidoreductase [Desulfomarina profundi]